ncbi:MAG TPA: ABC transporter ATP-binding protein [Rhodanobacter sp.]|nr:ABC transporter ATP-binding protein [Rhodanobacter sp.]
MANSARGRSAMSDIEIEEMLSRNKLNRSMFSRLVPLLHPVRYRVAAAIGLEVVLAATIFLRPWFIRVVIDNGFSHAGAAVILNQRILIWAVAGLSLTWVARFGIAGLSQYLAGSSAIRVLNALRRQVFAHAQSLSVGYFDRTKAGRIISRVDRDVDSLEPLLIQGPPALLSAILRCGAAGVLLWFISPALFFSLVGIVPILLLASWSFKRISQKNSALVAENRSRFTAHLVETVAGVRVIKQTVQEDPNRHRYRALLHDFNWALVRGNMRSAWFAPFTGVLSTTGMALLLLVGARGIALHEITFGQVAASLFYVQLFLGPLQELSDLFDRYATGSASAQRIFLLLDTKPEVQDRADAVTLDTVRGDVDFRAVTFAYDPKAVRPVLRDLNLSIPAGQVLAIVGPTGHGKSTLVQLLTRFYEVQQGAIRIDGVNIKDIAQESLRRHVSVVLQDNVLFSGTVLDNLRLARPEADDATLIAAAHALDVHEVIERLPHGYRTEVGPLGAHLSHGQRQLVCLVRAYIADPAILILDEATSAVDIKTERRIQRALRRLCEGRTAIVIAHRLATIRGADLIAVIRHGEVVELAPHDVLIAAGGFYASLYEAYTELSSELPQSVFA